MHGIYWAIFNWCASSVIWLSYAFLKSCSMPSSSIYVHMYHSLTIRALISNKSNWAKAPITLMFSINFPIQSLTSSLHIIIYFIPHWTHIRVECTTEYLSFSIRPYKPTTHATNITPLIVLVLILTWNVQNTANRMIFLLLSSNSLSRPIFTMR